MKTTFLEFESSIFEIFELEKTYDYKPIGYNKYSFKSKDGTKYYVKIDHNVEDKTMTVIFSSKKYHLISKVFFGGFLKDQFTNKNEPINILNTVIKICKDYYEQHSKEIQYFGISAFTKKRINVYLYIFKKYFKGWNIGEIKNDGGDLYSVTITKQQIGDNPNNFLTN